MTLGEGTISGSETQHQLREGAGEQPKHRTRDTVHDDRILARAETRLRVLRE
jgi:hypothetical protein